MQCYGRPNLKPALTWGFIRVFALHKIYLSDNPVRCRVQTIRNEFGQIVDRRRKANEQDLRARARAEYTLPVGLDPADAPTGTPTPRRLGNKIGTLRNRLPLVRRRLRPPPTSAFNVSLIRNAKGA